MLGIVQRSGLGLVAETVPGQAEGQYTKGKATWFEKMGQRCLYQAKMVELLKMRNWTAWVVVTQ